MQSSPKVNTASAYFNKNWEWYQRILKNNTIYHREMVFALREFLSTRMEGRAFSFVDVGCGDGSQLAPILTEYSLLKYIGIDAAKDVLAIAADNLAVLGCEKEFIAEDMLAALSALSSPVDIIFTSYAVHHLSLQDKKRFIVLCKEKLNPQGFLLMVDGVLKPNQTRDEWLDALEKRMEETITDVPVDEISSRMAHPRADDYPESIETFEKIAKQTLWKNFEVLVDKGIFSFMVFSK
jgi:SAM-dependent methyltransferase